MGVGGAYSEWTVTHNLMAYKEANKICCTPQRYNGYTSHPEPIYISIPSSFFYRNLIDNTPPPRSNSIIVPPQPQPQTQTTYSKTPPTFTPAKPFQRMADPFEVRMRFTTHLQHLNASSTSAQKAAHFALKHPAMAEDLHSCILEQLERNSMNSRANIMFFVDVLAELAVAAGAGAGGAGGEGVGAGGEVFLEGIRRDIGRIVDAVTGRDGRAAAVGGEDEGGSAAPGTGAGFVANGKVVRRVVAGLCDRGVLERERTDEILQMLDRRDRESAREEGHEEGDAGEMEGVTEGSSGASEEAGAEGPAGAASGLPTGLPAQQQVPPLPTGQQVSNGNSSSGFAGATLNGNSGSGSITARGFDKRQIEQRIEEDRERHKKLREGYWTVQPGENELGRLWSEYGMLDEVDRMAAEEALDERRRAIRAS